MLVIETASALSISIRYNSDLFDPATVARMAVSFETLLRGIATDPEVGLDALAQSLARAERKQKAVARQRQMQLNVQKLITVTRRPVGLPQFNRNGAQ
jgi:non-ribosomal peptide synthetase component F